MSMDVREGPAGCAHGQYGESPRVITRDAIPPPPTRSCRPTRSWWERTRPAKQLQPPHPPAGRVFTTAISVRRPSVWSACRNNRSKGLLNGGIWKVEEYLGCKKGYVKMILSPEDVGRQKKNIKVDVREEFFEGTADDMPWELRKTSDEFDYGYALTVHKSQGSQWDNVVLFDESRVFRDDASRWLYTGVTRAAERVTVVAA